MDWLIHHKTHFVITTTRWWIGDYSWTELLSIIVQGFSSNCLNQLKEIAMVIIVLMLTYFIWKRILKNNLGMIICLVELLLSPKQWLTGDIDGSSCQDILKGTCYFLFNFVSSIIYICQQINNCPFMPLNENQSVGLGTFENCSHIKSEPNAGI